MSPFGDFSTMQTVVDKTVRDALEIGNADAQCSVKVAGQRWYGEDFDDFDHTFGSGLKFELDKVNVYNVGGHFHSHVDTPSPGVLGSLVVLLRNEFIQDQGGRQSLCGCACTDGDCQSRRFCRAVAQDWPKLHQTRCCWSVAHATVFAWRVPTRRIAGNRSRHLWRGQGALSRDCFDVSDRALRLLGGTLFP